METYRDLQTLEDDMSRLLAHLRDAILADDTREMGRLGGDAHAAAETLKNRLAHALASDRRGSDLERAMAQASHDSLSAALDAAQRVALGTNADEVRGRLLDFKTHADFAAAYLNAALGYEED